MPKVSIIMSTYNRENFLQDSINSVLNQSFRDFELIIINDASTDSTSKILSEYRDKRIKIFNNKTNAGCTFNYNVAQNLATGELIAHIDDDDLWLVDKLRHQVDFMNNNKDIVLLGSFIETFGENARPSWVFDSNCDKISFLMNFYNPICHSSIIYRNSFMLENGINYNFNRLCAQDYDLYKQILFANGKIANLPKILVRYRMHKIRLTDIVETQNIQILNAESIRSELLGRFLTNNDIKTIKELINGFPFNSYNKENVVTAINIAAKFYLKKFSLDRNILEEVIQDIQNDVYKF